MFSINLALYWSPKLAQVSLKQDLELGFAAASLNRYELFIFRGGVRKENYSRSSLNKLGNLLFLGGTFRLLALAAGWGQRGEGGEQGTGLNQACDLTTGPGARNFQLPPWPCTLGHSVPITHSSHLQIMISAPTALHISLKAADRFNLEPKK